MNLLQRLFQSTGLNIPPRAFPPSPPSNRHQKPRPFRIPVRKGTVALDERSLSTKRGWTHKGANTVVGYYRTAFGAWKGEITRRGDKFNVFIFNAPTETLQNHSRWICFYKKQGGGKNDFRINLALNPKDRQVDSIIFYVEQILIESFEMERT